jgi:FkbM family methyltransferase
MHTVEALRVIEVTKHGKTVLFDDTGIDPEQPGSVRAYLFKGGFYEEAFLDYIRSLGRTGVYVDAGAYIGTHTLYFAVLCGATHVHSFEPRARMRDELLRNVAANDLEDRVTVHDIGLSSKRTRVEVSLDRVDESFDCAPLDEIVEGDVAVIKIDVEGMEAEVLRGARRILSTSSPVIFAEAHQEEELAEIGKVLEEFGYYRTGRVFNASPTYEFAKADELSIARDQLERYASEFEALYQERKTLRNRLGKLKKTVEKLESELSAQQGEPSATTAGAKMRRWLRRLRN